MSERVLEKAIMISQSRALEFEMECDRLRDALKEIADTNTDDPAYDSDVMKSIACRALGIPSPID